MAVLMKDAIMPNLVQTIEGNPAIIHGGPFANIAQGTNSIIATKMGLSLSDYVVTEAGFASELGAEKFFNIKSQYANLSTNAVVLVATIRALKYHGGVKLKDINVKNHEALKQGLENLEKHVENIRYYGLSPVIAIIKFVTDTSEEIELIKTKASELNVKESLVEGWEKGGEGAKELAQMVAESAEKCNQCFKPLYDFNWTVEEKINEIATKMYGADHVEYSVQAKVDINRINELVLGNLLVCIAKTQKSLSDDPYRKGRPKGFTVKIREVELAAGAGFIIPIAGTIMRMPGLPEEPSAEVIDIDKKWEYFRIVLIFQGKLF